MHQQTVPVPMKSCSVNWNNAAWQFKNATGTSNLEVTFLPENGVLNEWQKDIFTKQEVSVINGPKWDRQEHMHGASFHNMHSPLDGGPYNLSRHLIGHFPAEPGLAIIIKLKSHWIRVLQISTVCKGSQMHISVSTEWRIY